MSPSLLPLELVVADILGTGDDVAQLLRQSMGEAGIDDHSSVLLFAVGSKPEANEAVLILPLGSPGPSAPGTRMFRHLRARRRRCARRVARAGQSCRCSSQGLLLSPVRALASQHGWRIAAPLGERAAGLVRQRYDSVRVQSPLARVR